MSYKHNIIKERFEVEVSQANEVKKATFEIDSNATKITGILLTSNNEKALYYRGSQKIQINDQELFPENFESKLLMSGLGVSPNQRMVKVGAIDKGNGRLEVWYKDEDHTEAIFAPYTVSIYVFSKVCE